MLVTAESPGKPPCGHACEELGSLMWDSREPHSLSLGPDCTQGRKLGKHQHSLLSASLTVGPGWPAAPNTYYHDFPPWMDSGPKQPSLPK